MPYKQNTIENDLVPFNEDASIYRTLWRAVIIRAIRDACEKNKYSTSLKAWVASENCKTICNLASLDYLMIRNKIIQIDSLKSDSAELSYHLNCFKSQHFKSHEKGVFYNEII